MHHPPMRRKSAIGLWLVVLAMLAAQLFLNGDTFEYRRIAAISQPWRLLTGHFVHLSLLHAILNCVALLLLGHLFAERLRPIEIWTILLGAPIAISLVFWIALPELEWYRGLSGDLHAIYFAGCVAWIATTSGRARWLPIAALIGGTLKVLLEQPWDATFPMHDVLRMAVVPQAHLIGAVIGCAAGLALRVRRNRAHS
jgi:rhomboid family GlyGly-CTERM serine protease